MCNILTGDKCEMKRKLFLSILIVFFTTSFMSLVGCNNQNPTKEQSSVSQKTLKEQYQLQEQCGKKGEDFYKKKFNDSGFYQNHYNKKLNKCFMVLYNPITNRKIFYDVNKSNLHGLFTRDGVSCYVYEKKCKTEEEWDNLMKPFMEE